MQWSKIKKRFEQLVAPSLQDRLRVHVTEYSHVAGRLGRGWITIDGVDIASVAVPSFYSNDFRFSTDTMNFGRALYAYINMPVDEARASTDPLLRGFAFLDRRIGKRSLRLQPGERHRFVVLLYALRCWAEGMEPRLPATLTSAAPSASS